MKKILISKCGSVDVLFEEDGNIPSIASNQLLIKMAATSINDIDIVKRENGVPPTAPPQMQMKFPYLLGSDFSGIVTEIGDNVTKFQVGDHVAGITQTGTYAEYITVDENSFVTKVPSDMDLVALGGLGVVSCTAWSAVMIHGKVQPNQRILIHGGAGGVGSMAVQLAKNAGAYVITTASEGNRELLKELGADEIIDYKKVNFEVELAARLRFMKSDLHSHLMIHVLYFHYDSSLSTALLFEHCHSYPQDRKRLSCMADRSLPESPTCRVPWRLWLWIDTSQRAPLLPCSVL